MTRGQRVVVVDGVPETAQVLRAVFEPRGHQVDRVRGFDLAHSRSTEAGVLVVHDDGHSGGCRSTAPARAARVVIASFTSDDDAAASVESVAPYSTTNERRLAQPFHYAELIRAVESLLSEEQPAAARVAA